MASLQLATSITEKGAILVFLSVCEIAIASSMFQEICSLVSSDFGEPSLQRACVFWGRVGRLEALISACVHVLCLCVCV